MTKNTLIISFILFLLFVGKVDSMPIYTDDIPQSRIDAANKRNKLAEINTAEENESKEIAFDEEKKVLIYSEKKVVPKYVLKKTPNWIYVLEPNVGAKLQFLTSEDVMKNEKIYIKKGTPVEGTVSKVLIHDLTESNRAPELHVSLFSTKDVTGKKVDLEGRVSDKSKINFITWFLVGYMCSPAKIEKDKIYTLYYK